jgi:hypothetical protein
MDRRKKCRHLEECSAPLCPMLSDEENKKRLWYPGEEICRRRKDLPEWVKQQRKVAKKIKPENKPNYFTLDMFMAQSRVTRGLMGLGSDQGDEEKQFRACSKTNKGTVNQARSRKEPKHMRNSVGLNRRGKTRAQRILEQILAPDGAGGCSSENQPNNNQVHQNMEVK